MVLSIKQELIKRIVAIHPEVTKDSDFFDLMLELYKRNYLCFEANMRILEIRSKSLFEGQDHREISWQEWRARNAGEARVYAKEQINALLLRKYPTHKEKPWISLFTFGDCIDRLTIEGVKQWHFKKIGNTTAFESSRGLTETVLDGMGQIIRRCQEEGCYLTHIEQRTYVLEK